MNNPAHPPTPCLPDPATVAARLDSILAPLMAVVAAHFRILGVLTIPLWTRLSRARQLFARLLAQLAAGHRPRPARSRPAPIPAVPSNPVVPLGQALGTGPVPPMSRRFAWVVARIGYPAAGFASQLNHLLQQPGVAETIAASPGTLRTLRPLCRILGIELPVALRLPPRPPRLRRPAIRHQALPASPPGTPDRPLPAYIRAAVRAWKRGPQKFA